MSTVYVQTELFTSPLRQTVISVRHHVIFSLITLDENSTQSGIACICVHMRPVLPIRALFGTKNESSY